MKKIIQSIGLMALMCFSFMYTDKVMEVINEKDSLMIELETKEKDYKIDPVPAIITKDTIIPGITGKSIDIANSYNKMRELGIFREDLLEYYQTYPKILLKDNLDKYIISANPHKQEVALIFRLKSDKELSNLLSLIAKYNLKINLYANTDYLETNLTNFDPSNIELYNYGDNGTYSHDNILLGENIIKNKTNSLSLYCLTLTKDQNTLNNCKKDHKYTLIPSIIGNNTPYNNIKANLKSGSLILLDLNNQTLKELPTIIDFIKGKGLTFNYLSQLLAE